MIKLILMKFTFGTLFILVILSVACSDDDGTEGLPLVGTTWAEVSFEATNCEDELKERTINCSGDDCDVIVFNADGTITIVNPEVDLGDSEYTYKVDGNKLTTIINASGLTITQTFEYEIIGNKLIFSSYDENVLCLEIYTYQGS